MREWIKKFVLKNKVVIITAILFFHFYQPGYTKLTDRNVKREIMNCKKLDNDSKKWVLAQARLETGWYKSRVAREDNNLFGLYDSKNKKYYKFKHWKESIDAYAELVQSKRRNNEDYEDFLNRIGYSESKNYTNVLKKMMKMGR